MTVEVQYYCDRCEQKFVVYHDDEQRLKCCGWCGNQVAPTGRIRTREGNLIVTYTDGVKTKEEMAFGAGMVTRLTKAMTGYQTAIRGGCKAGLGSTPSECHW